MTTFTATLPVRKSSKASEVTFTPALDNAFSPVAGVASITTDHLTQLYIVEEYSTGCSARGFVLHKLGGVGSDKTESFYTVRCRKEEPETTACSCKGFQFKGHCKHVDSLNALVAADQL